MKTPLASILRQAGHRPFCHQSSDPKYNAQRNLQGRTHYVDDDTLRGFQARISYAGHHAGGLLFAIVESVASRPEHGGATRRYVIFDVFGTVLNDRDQWFRTAEKARKAMFKAIDAIDAEKHTRGTLKATAQAQIANAKETLASLR